MHRLFSLVPIFIFLLLFLGSGIYFYATGVEYAFYQVSPTVAIVPALIVGVIIGKGRISDKIQSLLTGIGNKNIITMCLIFILAGAFGVVTQAIGCVDDLVHFTLTFLPPQALLPGLLVLSAFISLSVGSSMGVIAAVTPIALGFTEETGLPLSLTVGTVVGGAMLGDNLSMISDTTIAAVTSQKADLLKKFKLNAGLASVAGAIVLVLLFFAPEATSVPAVSSYSLLKILPYFTIIILAMLRMNVFSVLIVGIVTAGFVGVFDPSDYAMTTFTKDIYKGFASMNEIMVLSLLVGGMSGLMQDQGGVDFIIEKVNALLQRKNKSSKRAEFAIAGLVSFNDLCIANNTIAIVLTGDIARKIAQENNIAPHRAACWLSIFSCVFQGLIPYSAQILLACSIANLSPISLITEIYYCYVLLGVTLIYMIFSKARS